MRRAAKPDANQEAIRTALRQMGCVVIPCGQLENAFDQIVCYRGKTFIMEIKNPDMLPKVYDRERLERSLTDGERKTMEAIEQTGVTYHIVTSVEQAIEIVTS